METSSLQIWGFSENTHCAEESMVLSTSVSNKADRGHSLHQKAAIH